MADEQPDEVVTLGFQLPRSDRDAVTAIIRQKFGISHSDYFRIVVKAIIEDRLTIAAPKGAKEIYTND